MRWRRGSPCSATTVSELRLFGSAYGLLSTSAVYVAARVALGPLGCRSRSARLRHAGLRSGRLPASGEHRVLHAAVARARGPRLDEGGEFREAGLGRGGRRLRRPRLSDEAERSRHARVLRRRRPVSAPPRGPRGARSGASREFARALAGFAAVFAVVAVYFAARGALGDYVECAWLHIGGYVGERQRDFHLGEWWGQLARIEQPPIGRRPRPRVDKRPRQGPRPRSARRARRPRPLVSWRAPSWRPTRGRRGRARCRR